MFYRYIASILFGCCLCFALVFKCVFSGVLFACVSDACFNCLSIFFCMFQMVHLYVSIVDRVLHMLLWLYTYVSSVSSVFRRMLQMFHLDVSKVDLGEAYVAAAMRHHGSPCRRGSLRALTGGGVAHVKRSRLGVVPPHAWARVASGAGWVRGERVGCVRHSGAGVGAPSYASVSDRTSRR
jgi:hypothetical protein